MMRPPPPAVARLPLLVLAPIVPNETGNGLAMRVASFVRAADRTHDVKVAVVPVAGGPPRPGPTGGVEVTVVDRPPGHVLRRQLTQLLGDAAWRRLLADAEPMPSLARAASVALAPDVVEASGAAPGTPVHVVRSYLAPLGLAVAQCLASPWTSLDLDDDDESMAHDGAVGAAIHRLVATFAPRFSAVCLASTLDADAVGRRHGVSAMTVVNSVAVPDRCPPVSAGPNEVLFVGNLTYGPNVEAAIYLVERVLPSLRSAVGRPVHVTLIGDYFPDGPVGVLAAHPSVTVTGYVDDLAPFYARAGVVVAPLATGSGTRIKLLEAFAHGVPVVTTPIGAAGLAVHHGEHLMIATTGDAMASVTAAVLNDVNCSDALASAAFEFVQRHHAPEAQARQVREFLCSASRAGISHA